MVGNMCRDLPGTIKYRGPGSPGQYLGKVREIVMSGSFLWALLFVGNAALLWLWVNYVVKVLIGRCPHCGR